MTGRILGLGFFALTLLALWRDWAETNPSGFVMASLGQRWAELHRTSLIGLQSGLENRVNPDLFFDYILPVLELPAATVAGVLAVLCLAVSTLSWTRRSA